MSTMKSYRVQQQAIQMRTCSGDKQTKKLRMKKDTFENETWKIAYIKDAIQK